MVLFLLAAGMLLGGSASAQEASWPDLSEPARAIGGGEQDAAVVVGVEGYAFVPAVPGAESNAKLWHRYLAETRGVPAQNVKLLTGLDATREEILEAARKAAERAGPKGALWFVFIGHGAPSQDSKDGLLVAVDAQQKAASLQSHSVRRGELLKVLGESRAGAIHVVLDACFSGRGPDGASIAPGLQPLVAVSAASGVDPRVVVLTAAKGDQFAGPLPGSARPAFSYLVLGGLRGWAAKGGKGAVTAGQALRYAGTALEATLRGRNQTPDLIGREEAVLAVSAGESGPDLARLAEATAGGKAPAVKSVPAQPNPAPPRRMRAARAEPGKAGIGWVTIPGGEFLMGATAGTAKPLSEKPVHPVLVKTFQIARTLVTQGQYQQCVDAGACAKPSCGAPAEDHPAVCVTWDQAAAFSRWAGGRLPTEAEWEYAARSGGKPTVYPWGDERPSCELAVFNDDEALGKGCARLSTWPVCSKPAGGTEHGLCDMAGNVWQMTQDWYHDSYNGAPADGSAWESPAGVNRVMRGGGWDSPAYALRASDRAEVSVFRGSKSVGFRPVRSGAH